MENSIDGLTSLERIRMNPYEVLGIKTTATIKEIKKAFRQKAHHNHPDKGGTVELFHPIQKAYDVLSDPSKRKIYDETGKISEDVINNFQAEVYSLFMVHFNAVIGQLLQSGQVPEKHDLVSMVKRQVQGLIDKEIKPAIANLNKTIEMYTKLKKRFKAKGNKVAFTEVLLNSAISSNKQKIELALPKLKVAERVLELLDTVDFDVVEEEMYRYSQATGNDTATASTYSWS